MPICRTCGQSKKLYEFPDSLGSEPEVCLVCADARAREIQQARAKPTRANAERIERDAVRVQRWSARTQPGRFKSQVEREILALADGDALQVTFEPGDSATALSRMLNSVVERLNARLPAEVPRYVKAPYRDSGELRGYYVGRPTE